LGRKICKGEDKKREMQDKKKNGERKIGKKGEKKKK
jgi:hypothetical protein